ncbi:AAA family ATPase [Candidatus Saccharibacteria bacterium]|nr:AAA family ATPase [Candidatus Saccharibacteria bacterium]
MKIYGLAGTNGAGKDSLAEMLVERHKFYFAIATDMLREELEKRGLPTDRVHKSQLSSEWRRQYGMAAIVDRAWEDFQKVKDQYDGIIIGSLRHPGEVDKIHELGGEVIWVDADPQIRYARIQNNDRGRVEDRKTFDEFMADEAREMQPEGDEATLHVAAVKAKADIFIDNDGNDITIFKDSAEKQLYKH